MFKNNTRNLDNINLVFVGVALGVAVCAIMSIWTAKTVNNDLERYQKEVTAFKVYYHNVETLLDSLDCTYSLCLEDGALQSTAGENYLDAKAKVDSLIFKQY